MAAKSLFLAVFVPEGWPLWVAPEYGIYQLWDTIQQTTFFVNTVISQQAVMKFHGVGDPSKSPASAAALEMSRNLLAVVISMVLATPGMATLYKKMPRVFRMSSECLNALGHFFEIIAALFSHVAALLYLGPIVCKLSFTMSSAVRSVILQHFAKGGQLPPGRRPDFGDISFKESNQDKGGKVVGLLIGIVLLGFIGMGDSEAAQEAALHRSVKVFAALTVVHILGNVQAVRELKIPQQPEQQPVPQPGAQQSASHQGGADRSQEQHREGFLKRMFTPKGYPHTVVSSYKRYRGWCLLQNLTGYPKQVVTSMLFWSNIYGVGKSSSTPSEAVIINVFMMGVDCVVGLLTGLPLVTQGLDYTKPKWFLLSAFMGLTAEFLMLASAVSPKVWFYVIVVIAKSIAAFGGTSGSRVNGSISPALMDRAAADRGDIELLHINMANTNQDRITSLPVGVLSIGFLYGIVWTGWAPSLHHQFLVYSLLQAITVVSLVGRYQNLPPLHNPAGAAAQEPLLPPQQPPVLENRSFSSDATWEEENDRAAVMANTYSGPAAHVVDLQRTLTP